MKLLVAVVLLIASATASAMAQKAEPVERWECRDFTASNWNSIIVTATINDDRTTGTVVVAGTTWYTSYFVEGFDRRWDFGPKEHPARYAFVIFPNLSGAYYDFSLANYQTGTPIKAEHVMECRQR